MTRHLNLTLWADVLQSLRLENDCPRHAFHKDCATGFAEMWTSSDTGRAWKGYSNGLGQCSSNFIVCMNYLGMLLKCSFWFGRSNKHISNKHSSFESQKATRQTRRAHTKATVIRMEKRECLQDIAGVTEKPNSTSLLLSSYVLSDGPCYLLPTGLLYTFKELTL